VMYSRANLPSERNTMHLQYIRLKIKEKAQLHCPSIDRNADDCVDESSSKIKTRLFEVYLTGIEFHIFYFIALH